MLTWRLYRTLNEPLKREPRIWRGYERLLTLLHQRIAARPRPQTPHVAQVIRFIGLLAFIPVINIAVIGLFFPSPLIALAANMVFSLLIVTTVSGTIARNHELHTYDLMSALPLGRMGIHWIHCTAFFEAQRRWRLPLQAIFMLGIVASPFLFGAVAFPLTGQRAVQFWLIDAISFAAFLFYDFLNMPVIAAVLGMVIPAYAVNSRNVRGFALGAWALLTLATYLLGAGIALYVLPSLLVRFGANFSATIIIAPITAIVVIAFRELVTRALWHHLKRTLNISAVELDLILR